MAMQVWRVSCGKTGSIINRRHEASRLKIRGQAGSTARLEWTADRFGHTVAFSSRSWANRGRTKPDNPAFQSTGENSRLVNHICTTTELKFVPVASGSGVDVVAIAQGR